MSSETEAGRISELEAELAAARKEVDRLLNVARGCHDYGGGYRDAEYEIFQHGISTVVRALVMAASASNDSQVNALEMIGKQAAIDAMKEAPDAE